MVKLTAVPTLEYYWTFIDQDDEIFDGEFKTKEEAVQYADEMFAEKCQEDSPRNGETFEEEITYVRFYYDDDNERQIVERDKTWLEYEHYHGDYAEHHYP